MAVSEELERSLRGEIERQIEALAGEHRDEVLRAQRELNDALARFTERLSGGSLGDPLASAISKHLRNARNEGADEAARSTAGASAAGDVALLKAGVDEIDSQRTQSDILNSLVNRAASFAPRVAFFVVKNDRATGWRARGLEGTVGDDRVRDISLPLTSDTILSEVYRTRAAWSGAPGSKAEDHELLSKLGGEPPARMVAVPMRDQRVGHCHRRIDPAIGRDDMDAVRLGPDPCEVGDHRGRNNGGAVPVPSSPLHRRGEDTKAWAAKRS